MQKNAVVDTRKRPIPRLYEGDQWGRVRVDKVFQDPKISQAGSIIEEDEGELHYVLSCACGHKLTVPHSRFPGKRFMRACGSAGCPYRKQIGLGRPPLDAKEQRGQVSLYLPKWMMERANELKRPWGVVSVSQVIEKLLRAGFEVEDPEPVEDAVQKAI